MSLTSQSIADDVNVNMREYFGAVKTTSGAVDADLCLKLFVPWVDQVQKDVLHTSIWSPLITSSVTFVSSPGGSPYTLSGVTNLRYILSVYDVKNRRMLLPYHDLNFPSATSLPPERSGGPPSKFERSDKTNAPFPEFYITDMNGADVRIFLLDDPNNVSNSGTIRVFYAQDVTTLTTATQALTLPEDARDIMVAGVSAHCAHFLRLANDAASWMGLYTNMKAGMAR